MTRTDDMAENMADGITPSSASDGASASSPPPDDAVGDLEEKEEEEQPGYKCILSPETEKRAQMELGETEDVRMLSLMGMKLRMAQRPDINFSHDDKFLLRFLRAKKFEIDRAFQSLVKYYELHLKHPDFFKDYKPSSIKHVLDDGFPMVLGHLDDEGRPVVLLKSVGSWNPRSYPVVDIAKAVFMVIENLVEDDEVQINGVVLVVDLSNIGAEHAMTIGPSIAKKLTSIFQNCVPVRLQGIHFVNEPLIMDAVFTIMKPFMQDKIKERMMMHGADFDRLTAHVPAAILPSEFGGETGPCDNTSWKEEFLAIDHEFSPIEDGVSGKKKKKKKKLGLKRVRKGTAKRLAKLTGKKSDKTKSGGKQEADVEVNKNKSGGKSESHEAENKCVNGELDSPKSDT